jgi:lysophospholipase
VADIRRDEGSFPSRDGIKLFWVSSMPEGAKAHVAIVHGYAEHIGRYAHVFDHLNGAGFAAHGFDCRGHGKSGGTRGHVRVFQEYLDDLMLFLERVKIAAGGKRVFLLGHSHGGLISARYALSHPPGLAGLVLTSPYFRLKLQPPAIKLLAARLLGRIMPALPLGNEIRDEDLTRDAEMVARHKVDPLLLKTTTPGWFQASTAAQLEVLAGAPGFTLPLGMFVGAADPIADPAAAREFFDRAGSTDKTFTDYPGALHEVLNETNRAEVLAAISGWLDARVG